MTLLVRITSGQPLSSLSVLTLAWRGRVWHFSVWNASWDQVNNIDLILCLQRVGIFPLIFFFSSSILWEVEEWNKGTECCQWSSGTGARARAAKPSMSLNSFTLAGLNQLWMLELDFHFEGWFVSPNMPLLGGTCSQPRARCPAGVGDLKP